MGSVQFPDHSRGQAQSQSQGRRWVHGEVVHLNEGTRREIIIKPLFLLKLALLSSLSLFMDFSLFSHVRTHVSIQPCSPSCVPEGVTDFPHATLSDSRAIQSAHPLASSQRKRGKERTVWHSPLHLLFVSGPPFQKRDYFCLGFSPKRTQIRSLDSKLEMGLRWGKKMRGRWGQVIPHAELRLHRAVTNEREKKCLHLPHFNRTNIINR